MILPPWIRVHHISLHPIKLCWNSLIEGCKSNGFGRRVSSCKLSFMQACPQTSRRLGYMTRPPSMRFVANKSRNGATRFLYFSHAIPCFRFQCFQQDSLVSKSKKIDRSVVRGTKKLMAILMARKQPSAQADCAVSYSLRVQSTQRHGRNERSAQQMSSLLRTHRCIQENRLFPSIIHRKNNGNQTVQDAQVICRIHMDGPVECELALRVLTRAHETHAVCCRMQNE